MKPIYLFIIIVSCLISVSAQSQYFSKTVDYDKGRDMVYSIETNDTGYVLTGASSDSLTWEVYLFFAHHDKFGNPTYHKTIRDTSNSYFCGLYGSLTRLRNGRYILGGSIRNKLTSDADALLYYFNANGDTIFTRQIQSSRFEIFNFVKEGPDGSWYAAGETSSMGDTMQDVFVMKFDSLGNVLWKKSYGNFGQTEYITSFDFDSAANLYLGISRIIGKVNNLNVTQPFVIKTDSSGNLKWQHPFGNMDSNYPYGSNTFLHLFSDNEIMVSYVKCDANLNMIPYIMKLDSNRNIVFDKAIGTKRRLNGAIRLTSTNDSNIIACGLGNIVPFPAVAEDAGFICKISPDGDVIWSRFYLVKSGQDQSFFQDIDTSHFGGYILAGGYWNSVQDIWLMSTDSMGCIGPDSCGVLQPVELASEYNKGVATLLVYPNPASHLLHIQIPEVYSGMNSSISGQKKSRHLYDPIHGRPANPFLEPEQEMLTPIVQQAQDIQSTATDCRVYLYATDGRLVRSMNQSWAKEMDLSLTGIPDGLYFLRVEYGGTVYGERVLVMDN
jgi:hypothetical protein